MPIPRFSCGLLVAVTALVLLASCGDSTPIPATSTVCDLPNHAQHLVQVDADISVDSGGGAVISDTHCASVRITLRLSEGAARAGFGDQLTAASKRAADLGHTTIAAQLTGVYTNSTTGPYFIAETFSTQSP